MIMVHLIFLRLYLERKSLLPTELLSANNFFLDLEPKILNFNYSLFHFIFTKTIAIHLSLWYAFIIHCIA